jgi:hypothetical protein
MFKAYFSRCSPTRTAPRPDPPLLLSRRSDDGSVYAEASASSEIAPSAPRPALLIGDVIQTRPTSTRISRGSSYGPGRAVIFMIKAIATYMGALTWRASATDRRRNQRRMFGALLAAEYRLLRPAPLSEFMRGHHRAGLQPRPQPLITSIGRDLLSRSDWSPSWRCRSGDVAVQRDRGAAGDADPAQADPRIRGSRITSSPAAQRILEPCRRGAGHPHRQGLHARGRMRGGIAAYVAEVESESNKWARIAHRSGR